MTTAQLATKAEAAATRAKECAARGDYEAGWAAVSEACEAAEATGFGSGADSERAWVAASEAESAVCRADFGWDPHA